MDKHRIVKVQFEYQETDLAEEREGLEYLEDQEGEDRELSDESESKFLKLAANNFDDKDQPGERTSNS